MTMDLIVNGLDHHYGSAQTLHGVDLRVPSGQCVAVMGTNGAGKTTLLKCLMGLEACRTRTCTFSDTDLARLTPERRVRLGLGYVPQGREIFPDLSVLENLLIAADHRPRAGESEALEQVFGLFPVLKSMSRRRGGNLSGGQQQQLAIGRALMGSPQLLILDEPTEGIQPNVIQAIQEVIISLKGRLSILLVEQYFDFARTVSDHYMILARGTVVRQGATDTLERDQASELFAL